MREHAVDGVAVQVVVDQVGAEDLQHRLQDAAGDGAGHQLAGRHALRGQHAEGAEVHAHVEGRGHHLERDLNDERLVAGRC